jgi:hypothetical protein
MDDVTGGAWEKVSVVLATEKLLWFWYTPLTYTFTPFGALVNVNAT